MIRLFVLFISLIFSSYIYSDDEIKCMDRICKDESCYEKGFNFTDINRDKSNKSIIEKSIRIAEYFKNLTLENDFIDVTEKILQDKNVKQSTKNSILQNISNHLEEKDGIFVVNFFGEKHGFVDQKIAYPITELELKKILLDNYFEIIDFKENIKENYKTQAGDIVTWHDYKIIAKRTLK